MKAREFLCFGALFSAVVLFIFWDIANLRIGFLRADYSQQFYPWYSIYANEIKNFHLPLWTRYVQCGFPLFAEGQIGALYPLNILLFFFLPFKIAYNYSFLFHFILCGFFTYFFARKIKSDFWGGLLAAILLCFGSAYAGSFVNISALKSLTWFPLVLILFEEYLQKNNKGFLFLIGVVSGMQLLAGAFQMSFYALLFYLLYFSYRNFQERRKFLFFIQDILSILSITLLISLPQLTATFQLSQYSNRLSRTLEFALWNSFSPPALIGSFLPYIGAIFSRGDIIYISVLGLFFAMLPIYSLRKEKHIKALMLLLVVSLFLAFGKYNPVYVILLKAFKFYSFRAPSRFVYFGVFALAILAGKGFTYFFNNEKIAAHVCKLFISILAVVLSIFLLAKAILRLGGPKILALAKDYVAKNIYGAAHHRYTLEAYMTKTQDIYNLFLERFSYGSLFTALNLLVVMFAALILYIAMKPPLRNGFFKYLCISFICAELGIFSFFSKGIWPDLASFSCVQPKEDRIYGILKNDTGIYRVLPFGKMNDMPLWLKPSMNAYYGLDSVAFYSPLANSDYYQKTEGLGIVDDSLGIIPPLKEDLYKKLDLLKQLNVKYIISTIELQSPYLDYVIEENGVYLYKMKDYLPRFLFIKAGRVEKADIKVEEYRSGFAKIILKNKEEGVLVFSEKFYPGWRALVDGSEASIDKFSDIVQAIRVSAGEHTIIFKFEQAFLKIF